jgi:hypothetical protein
METRIYLIKTPNGEFLVEARTPAQAIKHVTHSGVEYKAASSKDVATLMRKGMKVQVAGPQPEDDDDDKEDHPSVVPPSHHANATARA